MLVLVDVLVVAIRCRGRVLRSVFVCCVSNHATFVNALNARQIGLFFGVRAIEKSAPPGSAATLALRFLRYAQVPLIILLLAPLVFEAIGV